MIPDQPPGNENFAAISRSLSLLVWNSPHAIVDGTVQDAEFTLQMVGGNGPSTHPSHLIIADRRRRHEASVELCSVKRHLEWIDSPGRTHGAVINAAHINLSCGDECSAAQNSAEVSMTTDTPTTLLMVAYWPNTVDNYSTSYSLQGETMYYIHQRHTVLRWLCRLLGSGEGNLLVMCHNSGCCSIL